MILVDPRAGSGELLPLFARLGYPTELSTLAYGDFAFLGRGSAGLPVFVGIERKATGDLLSCIADGRFAGGQLPGLHKEYQVVFLLVEGRWREGKGGSLLIPRGRRWVSPHGQAARGWTVAGVEHWLTTMTLLGGCHVVRTADKAATARWVGHLYSWWRKPWKDHNAHRALDFSQSLNGKVSFTSATYLQEMVARLPGIGMERSGAVEKHFGAFPALIGVEVEEVDWKRVEKEWAEIPGVGKVTAAKVVRAMKERSV